MDKPDLEKPGVRAALVERITNTYSSRMEGATVAIVRKNDTYMAQLGTGSLFAVAGHYFVVTAGHVIVEADKLNADLAISNGRGALIEVGGHWHCSRDMGGAVADSTIDIAVSELNEEQRKGLNDKVFLTASDVDMKGDVPPSFYLLFGYPQMLCEPSGSDDAKLGLGALRLGTGLYTGSTLGLDKYDPQVHILLDAGDRSFDQHGNESDLKTRGAHKVRVPLTSGLKGISGCAVWRLRLDGVLEDVTADDWRLAGVQTTVYGESRAIRATRWQVAMGYLCRLYPSIAPALRLLLPR